MLQTDRQTQQQLKHTHYIYCKYDLDYEKLV